MSVVHWYRKRTLGSLLDDAAARYGTREALVFDGKRWTYDQVLTKTNETAKGLMALGVGPGDRVALWMTNLPEWLFVMFAVAKTGACLVPLNTRYRTDDVSYAIRQSRSRFLISLDQSGPVDYRAMLAEAMPDMKDGYEGELQLTDFPELRQIVFLGPQKLDNTLGFDALLAAGENISDTQLKHRADAVDPDGLMAILYTSGTTGNPKGVMHTHHPLRNTAERAQLYGMTFEDIHLNYLPLFHLYAYSEITILSVITGATQVLMDVFDADRALDAAVEEKATVLHGFEAHWLDLLLAQEQRARALPHLRLGTLPSGVDSTIPVAEKANWVFCPTLSGYGSSEGWPFITCSNPGHTIEQRVNTSGFPMNDYEFRIVDPETRLDQPVNISGEIWIRGYAQMKGYWDQPDATRETIDEEGWLHSGDVGLLRDDGQLVFQGRYKDMLKVGGENVSPAEVEAYLREMDEILDAAVVAYPDPRLTEVPVAFVLSAGDEPVPAEPIIARCKGRIASFKIPRHVITVDEFPMTPSGKIRKVALREKALEMLGAPTHKT